MTPTASPTPAALNELPGHTASPSEALDKRSRGVTPRVVVLCLVLAGLFGYILPVIDYKLYNTFLGGSHLPPGAIGVLLILILGVNPLLRRLSPRHRLSRNETLTVYMSCLFSCLVPGHGSENFLVPNLLAPFYFASRENGWLNTLLPQVNRTLTPAIGADGQLNPRVADGWYQGLNPGEAIPWAAWLVPMAFWISVVLVSYLMLGCLSVILRAQWAEREALAFPLLKLPLAMTEDMDEKRGDGAVGRFFRSSVMWMGFGVAAFVQLMRGLHLYFPDFPDFPLDLNTGPLFSEAPWNQIGWVPVAIFPLVVGVTFLLTSEISLSLWAFFWFFKLQYIIAYGLGYPSGTLPSADGLPDKVFTGYQQGGCYLVYVTLVMWTGREHFRHVARRAFGRERAKAGESEEMCSYPTAFWGFVGAFAALMALTCGVGVRLDVALALWLSYLLLAIGLSRVAVEGGMLALQHHTSPLGAISKLLGDAPNGWLTPASGVASATFFQSGMVNHMRGFIMPSFVHSFKLAHDHKIAPRPLLALLTATILISVGVSWWTVVRLGYNSGGLSLGHKWWAQDGARSPIWFLNTLGTSQTGTTAQSWTWLSFGAILTYGMMLARSRFAWFPFHPIGYMMALSYPTATFWFSIFLGWLAKTLITRFGGNASYKNAIPFFLGLVLGDVSMMIFWLIIDGWQGRTGHLLLPG